jgi:TetR/AcrR family transcriptional regulator, cholesterol catabolism regulator
MKLAQDPKEIHLLQGAMAVFTRLGVKTITMDDIARELGVSKKTLYLYFEDKVDLLKKTFQHDMHCDVERSEENVKKAKNAIDELFLVNDWMKEHFSEMHPSVVYDLQKFYPEVWALFKEFKTTHILRCLLKNIARGKQEDVYREKLDTEVYARFFVGRFELMFDTEMFPSKSYKTHEVHAQMIEYHVRAMATAKGLKQLEKQLEKQQL